MKTFIETRFTKVFFNFWYCEIEFNYNKNYTNQLTNLIFLSWAMLQPNALRNKMRTRTQNRNKMSITAIDSSRPEWTIANGWQSSLLVFITSLKLILMTTILTTIKDLRLKVRAHTYDTIPVSDSDRKCG